jgi:glutamate/aspartate transport system permease protein
MGILRTTPSKPLVLLGNAWTELFRNIPLLVQIFLWYHVIPSIFLSLRSVPSFVLVVFALGFFTSARISEQVRAGIHRSPRGSATPAAMADAAHLPTRCCRWRFGSSRRSRASREHHQEQTSVAFAVSIAELTMFAMQAQEETSRHRDPLRRHRALFRLGVRGQPRRRLHRAARPGAGPARGEVRGRP